MSRILTVKSLTETTMKLKLPARPDLFELFFYIDTDFIISSLQGLESKLLTIKLWQLHKEWSQQ